MELSFTLNDAKITLEVDPDARVVDLLREKIGLTGTKEGCGTGECGACTVLVDGETRLSCLMLAAQLEGREIVTIEGLSRSVPGRKCHPVQEAFVEAGAVQCGFCTPGMVITVADFIGREPAADVAAIRKAVSGNICRCTGYLNIVEAAKLAVKNKREHEEHEEHDA